MALHSTADDTDRDEYDLSWRAINHLLRSGQSWSGRERNNCYMSLGDGRFVDASYVSGLGFVEDGRGVAAVDWDADGDLDLWLRNRTAPQVRFMRNNYAGRNHFLAIRLRGTTCNRDAVGARVELRLADKTLIKSVRASNNYMAQAGKWIHFGLGSDSRIESLTIKWPDGTQSHFADVEPGRRYLLTQGVEKLESPESAGKRRQSLLAKKLSPSSADASASIWLTARVPLPPIKYLDFKGEARQLSELGDRPIFLNLWANWCAACVTELSGFVRDRNMLEQSGVALLALSVDEPAARPKAADMARDLKLPFPTGVTADTDLVALIDALKRTALHRFEELPLPTSVLIDRKGRIAKLYLGPCEASEIVADVKRLAKAKNDLDILYQAAAYPRGKWQMPGLLLSSLVPKRLLSLTQELADGGYFAPAAFYGRLLMKRISGSAAPASVRREAREAILAAASGLSADGGEAAVELYRAYLKEEPDNPTASLGLTYALLGIGTRAARAEAAEVFETALTSLPRPSTPGEWSAYGETLYRLEQWTEAIPYLRQAAQALPSDAVIRARLGVALIKTNRDAEGIAQLESAMKEEPPNALHELTLARALDRTGKPQQAENNYRRFLELAGEPKTDADHALFGNAYSRLRDWGKAIPHLQRAVVGNEKNFPLRMQLGMALLRAGRNVEGLPHVQAALPALEPSAVNEYFYAMGLARAGKIDQAVVHFQKALELKPDHRMARQSLAIALDRMGRVDEAIKHYEEFLELVPGDLKTLERIGAAQQRAGRMGDAINTFRRLLEAQPDHARSKYHLAWLLSSSPRAELRGGREAVRLAKELVASEGREATLIDLLAAAYAEAGQFDQAVKFATEAIEIARSKKMTDLVSQIETRLRLYRGGNPYRQAP